MDLQVRFQLGWSKSLVPSQGNKTVPNQVTAHGQLIFSWALLPSFFVVGQLDFGERLSILDLKINRSDTVTELDKSDRKTVTEDMYDLID
jgi:hypothetical protein